MTDYNAEFMLYKNGFQKSVPIIANNSFTITKINYTRLIQMLRTHFYIARLCIFVQRGCIECDLAQLEVFTKIINFFNAFQLRLQLRALMDMVEQVDRTLYIY